MSNEQIKTKLFQRAITLVMAASLVCGTGISQTPITPVAADSGGRVTGPTVASTPAMGNSVSGNRPVGSNSVNNVPANNNVPGSAATTTAPGAYVKKGPERIPNYVLGPDDQITIQAFQAEELSNKPMQIAGDGNINLPLVGQVKAGGLSISELEASLVTRLRNFVKNPQVTVFVSEYRSQPVSVVGAVNTPGVVQLRGRKTLVEVIAMAGGLRADAGNMATVTRELSVGRLPLPDAADDPNGEFSIGHVNLHDMMDAHSPRENILVDANDVIMIPKAPLLYVVGEVQKPGGYAITERNSVSILQAVALAGGLTAQAAPKKARILYQTAGVQTRTEVAANVRKILDGQAPDIELHADDILFIPSNLPKSVGGKALETALNMAGIAVWKF